VFYWLLLSWPSHLYTAIKTNHQLHVFPGHLVSFLLLITYLDFVAAVHGAHQAAVCLYFRHSFRVMLTVVEFHAPCHLWTSCPLPTCAPATEAVDGWPYRGSIPGAVNLSQSNQPPRSSQPGHPSVGSRSEYRSKGGDAVRLGGKAGMVLFAGNTVWSISKRVRGVCA